ncbi:hypothetical protein COEREDRAFT_101035 [Coemansia reversa NRRL 1564]|uniref:Timeless N-terminal domain-containing protein n=1 Tax=Coemansia reversa (strain ATCC 12441 / NRRL 1564) TaxID=763665 RepID=A0A2G5BHC7_COERN|nr:hypothetical protein COEREDRAFT_101035 [Coemansia reversa NRRL 1564]|eukprot:PIA18413.1 hypothetical protein COEREDRAFT_101035 [Coemansia reversa NRRL 1564]
MEYLPSNDCLASLKDIKRYIQMDEQGEGKWVLQWLGEWNTLEMDIIPIFTLGAKRLLSEKHEQEENEDDREHILKVVIMCVELFVFLTWSMNTETEDVKTRFIIILRRYKKAFAKSEVVLGLLSIAVMYVRKARNSDREAMLVKGILYVFRNILSIPDPFVSITSKGLSQLETQDTLIEVLDKELAIDFFLTLLSSADQPRFKDLRATLLDIIYYIFYRVPVPALFEQQRTWFEDSAQKQSGRHTNFGGVYAVSTGEGTVMPVFSTREVLRPFANIFKDSNRVQRPRNEADGFVDRQWRSVDPDVLPILRRVAAIFIESCFNPFVGAMFEDTKASTTAVSDTISRLLYVAGYFVDISLANPEIDLGCTCALVQTQIFGQVMRLASTYLELKEWTSLDSAMYCIQQILLALAKIRGTKLNSLSENVLSNLFYDGDALDLFVKLCRSFRPTKSSHPFMEQVARLTDTFLNTLKEYAGSRSGMYVKKRVRKGGKNKNKKSVKSEENAEDEQAANDSMSVDGQNKEVDTAVATVSGSEGEVADTDDAKQGAESDSEAENDVLVERAFNFSKFEGAFATADVAKSFSFLLTPPSSIEYVYPMLYRIAVTCKRPELFFKEKLITRLLILFDDSLVYPLRMEMLDLASWIFRQYTTVMESSVLRKTYGAEPIKSKLAVECMRSFLKSSHLGTKIEPVITRHIVKILPSDKQGAAEVEGLDDVANDINGGNTTGVLGDRQETVPDALLEDMDDYDLDQYFNL